MKKNKYKLKKRNKILFSTISIIFIVFTFLTLNFRTFVDTEIQYFLSKNKNLSSIFQLFDEGNLFYPGKVDYSKINFSKILKISPQILTGFINENEDSKFENLKIFINFKNLLHIYEDRRSSLNTKLNIDPKFVPCKINYKNEIFRCSVRLKGDLHDHWSTKNRLSLRFKLKDGYINGTKEFSLHKPRARQFPYDYFFQKFNSKIGIPSSDGQSFFNVNFNNESWGVMHFEETINSDFLEKKKIKSTGIYRMTDQKDWEYTRISNSAYYPGYFLSHPSVTLTIKGNDNKILKDEQQLQIYSYILNNIKNNNSIIFDRERMIKNLISTLIWGTTHALSEDNTWFYWNPYTLKLVPVFSDQSPWMLLAKKEHILKKVRSLPFYYNFIFTDEPLTKQEFKYYFDELSFLFNNEDFLDSINEFKKVYFKEESLFKYSPLSNNIKIINENLEIIIDEINSIKKYSNDKLLTSKEVKYIKNFIDIKHFKDGQITISNLLDVPILIEKIYSNNSLLNINKTLEPSNSNNLSSITINTDFKGENNYNIKIISSYKNFKNVSKNKISLVNEQEILVNRKDIDYCKKFIENVCILKNNIEINRNIVFNERVRILPGSKIYIGNNNYIIFNNGADIEGTNLEQIKIFGKNGGNILINNLEKNSFTNIEYLNIYNLGKSFSKFTNYTGALNIYGGNVILKNSNFFNNTAEDQINIINSNIYLENLNIYNAISDGLDCDFCKGEILNLNLRNITGDALDIAGSTLNINNIKITDVNDKGISIGEKSKIKIKDVSINRVGTGVAVKDSSEVVLTDINLDNVIYDVFMTYVKKPFFDGNTSLIISNYKAKSFENLCVRQKNTFLKIEKKYCDEKDLNVDKLYKTRMKKL